MKHTYTAITCHKARQLFPRPHPSRPYGYTLAIDPPIEPEPDAAPMYARAANGKRCDSCQCPATGQLYDITSCGDWLTVCGHCRDRIIGKPQPRRWQGWYKFKADAVRRAADFNGGVA